MRTRRRRGGRLAGLAAVRPLPVHEVERTRLTQLAEFHVRDGNPDVAQRIYRTMLERGVAASEDARFARELRRRLEPQAEPRPFRDQVRRREDAND